MGYYGGDYTHALNAWQSTGHEYGTELETLDIDQRLPRLFADTVPHKKKSYSELLTMLAKDGHHTPFEASTLQFQVTADIASHIHCIKHRIGVSINAESARYKRLTREDRFYTPVDWSRGEQAALNDHCADCFDKYHECFARLVDQERYTTKRAKESARFYLPYATQLVFSVIFNFRSFVHFYTLRGDEHAQLEIQGIAHDMLRQVREIPGHPFEYSLEAFGL